MVCVHNQFWHAINPGRSKVSVRKFQFCFEIFRLFKKRDSFYGFYIKIYNIGNKFGFKRSQNLQVFVFRLYCKVRRANNLLVVVYKRPYFKTIHAELRPIMTEVYLNQSYVNCMFNQYTYFGTVKCQMWLQVSQG